MGDPNHLFELPVGAVLVGHGAALPKLRRMRSAWLRVWGSGPSLWGRVRLELHRLTRYLKTSSPLVAGSRDRHPCRAPQRFFDDRERPLLTPFQRDERAAIEREPA